MFRDILSPYQFVFPFLPFSPFHLPSDWLLVNKTSDLCHYRRIGI